MAKRGKHTLLLGAVAAGAAFMALRGKRATTNRQAQSAPSAETEQATPVSEETEQATVPSLYCGRSTQPYDSFYDYDGVAGGYYLDRADINAMGLLGDTSIVRARLIPEFLLIAKVPDGEKHLAVVNRLNAMNRHFETIDVTVDARIAVAFRVELFNPSDYPLPLTGVAIKEIFLNEQRLYRDEEVIDHDDSLDSQSSSFVIFKDENPDYTPQVIPPRGSLFLNIEARGLITSSFSMQEDKETRTKTNNTPTYDDIHRVLFMQYNQPTEDADGMAKLALNVTGANNEARTLTAGLYRGRRPQGGIKALAYERQYVGDLFPDLFIAKDAELDQLAAAAAATDNERRFLRTFRIDLAARDYYVSERAEAVSEALRRDYGVTLNEWVAKTAAGRQKLLNEHGKHDSAMCSRLYTQNLLSDLSTPDEEKQRWQQAEREGNSIDLESVIYWEAMSETERDARYTV